MDGKSEIARAILLFADQISKKAYPEIAEVGKRAFYIAADASVERPTGSAPDVSPRERALLGMIGGLLCVLAEKKIIDSNELDLIFAQAAGIGSIDETLNLRHAGRESDYPWMLPLGESFPAHIEAFRNRYGIKD